MTTTAEKIVPAEEKPVADKRRALGRGLDSLLPGGPRIVTGPAAIPATPPAPSAGSAASATHSEGVVLLNLDQIARIRTRHAATFLKPPWRNWPNPLKPVA